MNTVLTVTRNPFGFFSTANKDNMYEGIKLNPQGKIDDDKFLKHVERLLNTIAIYLVYPRILGSSHFFIAITGKEYPAHPIYSKVCAVEKP